MPSSEGRGSRRRALAQNFIRDRRVAEAIVDLLDPGPGSQVVDLGAGAGAMTEPLAARGAAVVAVELDPRWADHLRRKATGWGRVEVRQADALSTPLPNRPHLVASNAPYNLGTKLVRRVLAESHGLERAVFLLQEQAALRLSGAAGTGLFSATWAPWFELEVGIRVPPQAFDPRPSVTSATLTVTPREAPLLSPAAFGAYRRFLNRLFDGRQPTILGRLARSGGPARRELKRGLRQAGVDGSAPPSALGPGELVALFLATGRGSDGGGPGAGWGPDPAGGGGSRLKRSSGPGDRGSPRRRPPGGRRG